MIDPTPAENDSAETPGSGAPPPPRRRTFIEPREIPGLLRGAALGDAAALRRALGGRYGGRYGSLVCLALLALAAPSPRAAPGSST